MNEIIWFTAGFVSSTGSFLFLIFRKELYDNLFNWVKFSFISRKKLKFKLEMWYWDLKHFIRYKVLRK